MKNIFTFFFIFIFALTIYPQDKSFKITKNWIDVQERQRGYFQKRDLLLKDTETIGILESSEIPAEFETEISDLLYEIIKYDSQDNPENSLKGVKLLETKIQDKSHFFRIAADFANLHAEDNPMIIAQILIGMKNLIKGHYEENLKTMQMIFESIRGPYITGSKSGTQKYKTDVVIKYLKEYLAEFDRLYKAGDIEKDTELEQVIINIKIDMERYELL